MTGQLVTPRLERQPKHADLFGIEGLSGYRRADPVHQAAHVVLLNVHDVTLTASIRVWAVAAEEPGF